MKKMMNLVVAAGALVLSTQALAQKPADVPECTGPVAACEKAGFQPGEHKKNGKGLWVDCIGARAHDKAVEGVTITKEEAKACADAAKAVRGAKKR